MAKTPKRFQHLKDKFVTIVALGDSITAVNHWTHGALNWAGLLWCGITCFPKGFTIVNSGIGGDSMKGGLARLDRDVLRFNPDIVIISYGVNDMRHLTPDKFGYCLDEAIRRIRDHGRCEIILRTPNPIVNMENGQEITGSRVEGKFYPNRMSIYAGAIRKVARRRKTILVDHYALWKKSMQSRYAGEMMLLMGNQTHPNANGHRRLYHEMAPVFNGEHKFQHEWEHLLMM